MLKCSAILVIWNFEYNKHTRNGALWCWQALSEHEWNATQRFKSKQLTSNIIVTVTGWCKNPDHLFSATGIIAKYKQQCYQYIQNSSVCFAYGAYVAKKEIKRFKFFFIGFWTLYQPNKCNIFCPTISSVLNYWMIKWDYLRSLVTRIKLQTCTHLSGSCASAQHIAHRKVKNSHT